jgi:CHAD domain-containing protein
MLRMAAHPQTPACSHLNTTKEACHTNVTMAQPPTRDTAADDARRFAVGQARAHLRRLALRIGRAIESCDADAVHDVRVAIRRFTGAIALCQPYVRSADLRKNRRRLKKIMTVAGELRNCDVALKLIAKMRIPKTRTLSTRLEKRRKQLALPLMSELKKWRRKTLPWRAALRAAETASAEESIQQVARRLVADGTKDFLEQGKQASSPEAPAEELHRFRITAKKFRYSLELFQPVYGTSLSPILASIKGLSALLGDINDCVTVAALAAKYDGSERVVDRLEKRQNKITEEFREYWKGLNLGRSLEALLEAPAVKKPVAGAERGRKKSVA